MKKSLLLSFIFLFFITISCKEDVFERQPIDKISENDVWDDENTVRAYLTDLYSKLPNMNGHDHWSHWDQFGPFLTVPGGNQNTLTTGNMTRNNESLGLWNYSLVREINTGIEQIRNFPDDWPISVESQDQMLGELLVMRAMVYYEMQIRYGGVPLVDVVIDPFNLEEELDEKYTERSTEEAIADFIDADLTEAIPLLTENSENIGRINKWTAYAAKARANLWAGSIAKYGNVELNGLIGIPSNRANDFFAKASDAANEVILSGEYSLFEEYTDKVENYYQLFIDDNNGEYIFGKLYDGVTIITRRNAITQPQSLSAFWGSNNTPTFDYILASENIDGSSDPLALGPDNLYDYASQAFEGKDPRIRANTIFDQDIYAGHTIRSYDGIDPSAEPNPDNILDDYDSYYEGMRTTGVDSRMNPNQEKATLTGLLGRKMITPEILVRYTDNTWPVHRLAEMFLIRAEAEFEVGNLETAATALNATRERAGISLVDASTITLDHVRTERMIELFSEEHIWWDLRRWRNAEEILNGRQIQGLRMIIHYESGKTYLMPFDAEPFTRSFSSKMYYNPITDSRIDNNTDLVENPGY